MPTLHERGRADNAPTVASLASISAIETIGTIRNCRSGERRVRSDLTIEASEAIDPKDARGGSRAFGRSTRSWLAMEKTSDATDQVVVVETIEASGDSDADDRGDGDQHNRDDRNGHQLPIGRLRRSTRSGQSMRVK